MYLLFFQIFGGLRLFKRLRLKFFANLYKATFIWEAMFIRDPRVWAVILLIFLNSSLFLQIFVRA